MAVKKKKKKTKRPTSAASSASKKKKKKKKRFVAGADVTIRFFRDDAAPTDPFAAFRADPELQERPEVLAAYEIAVARYLHRPEVTGIDIGVVYKKTHATGEIGVRIHVREKKNP